MTPITHITPREQALQRENERLTDQVKRQSATIHVQAVAIQSLDEQMQVLKADAERYRFWRDRYPITFAPTTMTPEDVDRCTDNAMKETK